MSETRQDFVDWVSENEEEAFNILGPQKWEYWATSPFAPLVSRMHEAEYNLWIENGDTEQLRNRIRFSAGLPAVGTGTEEDFSGAKKRLGDQYRQDLAIAQNVLKMSQDEMLNLKSMLISSTDPTQTQILKTEIVLQQNTIDSQTANVSTWQKTLNDSIASGYAV